MAPRDVSPVALPALSEWTQRVGPYVGLPALIRHLGVDPEAAMAAAGLPPNAFDHPENRVPYAAIGMLLANVAQQTGCEHVGLLAGRQCNLASLGLVGELTRHSTTLGQALHTLVGHQHVNSGGGLAFMIQREGFVDLGYAIYHPYTPGADQICDAVLAAAMNFMRELCGSAWLPTEVLLPHRAPRDVRQHRGLFRLTPHFNAECCALRFPARWMDVRVAGADPLRRRRAEALARRLMPPTFLQQVYRAIRVLLLEGRQSGDAVAEMLAMHRRTLNRRLKAEDTTFQQMLDRVRFEVACQLLAGSTISLDDVADALGYAGVSPFMRTFRRWSGTTPGRWRRLAGEPNGAAASIAPAARPDAAIEREARVVATV